MIEIQTRRRNVPSTGEAFDGYAASLTFLATLANSDTLTVLPAAVRRARDALSIAQVRKEADGFLTQAVASLTVAMNSGDRLNQAFLNLQTKFHTFRRIEFRVVDYKRILGVCLDLLSNDVCLDDILEVHAELLELLQFLSPESMSGLLRITTRFQNVELELSRRLIPTEESPNAACSICCTYENHPFCRLRCGDVFHAECVNFWLLNSSECPVCRQVALDVDLQEVTADIPLDVGTQTEAAVADAEVPRF